MSFIDMAGGRKNFGFLLILVMAFTITLVQGFSEAKQFVELVLPVFMTVVVGLVGSDLADNLKK